MAVHELPAEPPAGAAAAQPPAGWPGPDPSGLRIAVPDRPLAGEPISAQRTLGA